MITIQNFYTYTDTMLEELRESLKLSMDLDILRVCVQQSRKLGNRDITTSELRIIDEIIRATPKSTVNTALTEVLCENSDIIDTFNDLLAKNNYLSSTSSPLSLSSAAQVSTKYMDMIGVKTPPIPKELMPSIKDDHASFISDIIEHAKSSAPESIIATVAKRLHSGRFEIDEHAFEEYFLPTVNKLIGAILGHIAYGYDRQLISLYLSYGFPKDADDKKLGNCLATLLGAYRLTCELCMSNVSAVNYTDSADVSIKPTAFVKTEKNPVSKTLTSNNAMLYLFSFNRLENGMPDFESLRNMCERFHILSTHGMVLSATAVNGRLGEAISKMEDNCRLVLADGISDILDDSFCGIIFETYVYPKNAVKLGKVELIHEEMANTDTPEDTEAEETQDLFDFPKLIEPLEVFDEAEEETKTADRSDEQSEPLEQIETNASVNGEENS